jgi:type IV secretory pathway VirB10-like protein
MLQVKRFFRTGCLVFIALTFNGSISTAFASAESDCWKEMRQGHDPEIIIDNGRPISCSMYLQNKSKQRNKIIPPARHKLKLYEQRLKWLEEARQRNLARKRQEQFERDQQRREEQQLKRLEEARQRNLARKRQEKFERDQQRRKQQQLKQLEEKKQSNRKKKQQAQVEVEEPHQSKLKKKNTRIWYFPVFVLLLIPFVGAVTGGWKAVQNWGKALASNVKRQ